MGTESQTRMPDSMTRELERLVQKSRWRETLLLATKNFEDHLATWADRNSSPEEDIDAISHSGPLAEVKNRVKEVWDALSTGEDASRPVAHLLSGLRDWEGVLEVPPSSGSELCWLRANALRSLGRQDEALEELEDYQASPVNTEQLRLLAALLCDVGNFEEALAVLEPATNPIEGAPETVLTLRGWAHQNCEGEDHARQAEQIYRLALQRDPEDHWSRKGLANALRRLGKVDEARVEYERVVEYAREQRRTDELDPYDACLAGWCCYCLGRPKEGADFSSTGLAAIGVGSAAQFDYGLMLLADLQLDAARDQFEWSIEGLDGKNSLRRCGLLYVALTDLGDAILHHPALAKAPESYLIQKELGKALEDALASFPRDKWVSLRTKMEAFLDRIKQEDHLAEVDLLKKLTEDAEEIDWSEIETRGFINDAPKRPVALFSVTVSHKRLPKLLFRVSAHGPLTAILKETEEQRTWNPEGGAVSFTKRYAASQNSRVLWVANEVLAAFAVHELSLDVPLRLPFEDKGAWEELAGLAAAKAAVIDQESGEVLSDELAKQLTKKAVAQVMQYFQQGGADPCQDAVDLAEFAISAAVSDTSLHAALLAFGLAGGSIRSPQLLGLQPKLSSWSTEEFAALERDIEDFKMRSLWRAQMTSPRSSENEELSSFTTLEDDKLLSPSGKLRKSVLMRARSIAELLDTDEQNRLAVEAAAEMQSLVPIVGSLETLRSRLAEEMNTMDKIYLESDESVLLMSREPAFYAPRVLLKTDPPLIHTFAFHTQTRRMQQAGLPVPSVTLFVE